MSLKFKKISGSTPYLLNSASTAEELTIALEDYMRTGAQIIFQHDGEDCILTSFEYKTGIESTVIAYFVTPKKKLLKVDIGAGYDLVITESDIAPDIDITWENLQDKPFGEVVGYGDTLTVNKSVLEGNIVTDTAGVLVKVSDAVPTIDDFINGLTVSVPNETPMQIPYEELLGAYNGFGVVGSDFFFVAPSDNFVVDLGDEGSLTFPEKGFYSAVFFFDMFETISYTIPNYKGFATTTLKQIDEKYLPDQLQFGETTENIGDTITWDGNIDESKDVVVNTEPIGTGTGRYVKVSDAVPTIDDIGSDSTFKYTGQGSEETQKVTPKTENGIIKIYGGFLFIAIATTDNIKMGNIVFPEKGVYFMQMVDANGNEVARCTSFTIPNYNFGTKTTIKEIDEKYLPDTILIKSESAEIWMCSGGTCMNWSKQVAENGITVNVQVVETLPDNPEPTDVVSGPLNLYVLNSTGVAYLTDGETELITLGYLFAEIDGFDKGWTVDPSVETEEGLYCVRTEKIVPTKEYVDNAVAKASGGGIIDVAELPTVGNEGVLYRVPTAQEYYYLYEQYSIKTYVVDGLPTEGFPVTTDMQAFENTYYNAADGVEYGYVPDAIANAAGVSAGWYPMSALFGMVGAAYGGVIGNLTEITEIRTTYLLLEYKLYYYKNGWHCATRETVTVYRTADDNQIQPLSDEDWKKLTNNYLNIDIKFYAAIDHAHAWGLIPFDSYNGGEITFSKMRTGQVSAGQNGDGTYTASFHEYKLIFNIEEKTVKYLDFGFESMRLSYYDKYPET